MLKEVLGKGLCIRECDTCGEIKTVSYWNIKRQEKHYCRTCANKQSFEKKRDGYKPWNIGKTYQSCSGNSYVNRYGYRMYYIGDKSYKGGYIGEHRIVMELSLGRRLVRGEVVHHIDGNKLNNDLSNLLLTNKNNHRKVHHDLEKVAFKLVQRGFIKFINGSYHLEPNMWEHISKSLELLGNPTPLTGQEDNQQRSPLGNTNEERSTTIQKWSTLK